MSEKPGLFMRRTLTGLATADEASALALRRIKQGAVVACSITRPRNIQHHRRFFAMLNTVWMACGDWKDTEELLTELKFRVGLVETQRVVDRKTGEVLAELVKPGSISFAAMNEDQFSEFYNKCINVICTDMVPGLSDSVLRDEVLRACA